MNLEIKHRVIPESNLPEEWPELIKKLYAARGVTERPMQSLSQLPGYKGFKGIVRAASIICKAVQTDAKIIIVGDYDVDGATSTALAIEALRSFGANHVSYLVPNRISQGYGLSPELADIAHQQGASLLITVDNGISTFSGVARAKELGMRVVITDHHLPGETIPQADAIVNPALTGQKPPGRNLAGVGVIFYVMASVRAELDRAHWFRDKVKPNMSTLLDLVALGTIADVVKLDSLNRLLARSGLDRIQNGQARPGIDSLIRISQKTPHFITSVDLAFSVAPKLNAAGRLEDMGAGIECLLTNDPDKADQLAESLNQTNLSRRQIEREMHAQAIEHVEHLMETMGLDRMPSGFCLFEPTWHEGVIGLVAGKLKEKFNRPVVAFATGQDGNLKGSVRSIPGIHARDVLASIDSRLPGLILKFGGHAMASGLSVKKENLAAFQVEWINTIHQFSEPGCFDPVLWTDGSLQASEITLENAMNIELFGPWGQAFPEPIFDNQFVVEESRIVGEQHLRLILRHQESGDTYPAIAFYHREMGLTDAPDGKTINIAYKLGVNRFRGEESLQLMVENYLGAAND